VNDLHLVAPAPEMVPLGDKMSRVTVTVFSQPQ
jgi:hypothetical protein